MTVSSEIARNAEWQNVEVPIDNNMQTLKRIKMDLLQFQLTKNLRWEKKHN